MNLVRNRLQEVRRRESETQKDIGGIPDCITVWKTYSFNFCSKFIIKKLSQSYIDILTVDKRNP